MMTVLPLDTIIAPKISHSKTLICEFIGLPGVGKTTNCSHFTKRLHKLGLNVVTLDIIKSYKRSLTLYQRAKILSLTLTLDFPTIYKHFTLLKYTKSLTVSNLKRFIGLLYTNRILISYNAIYKPDIALLDQWFTQAIWSALVFNNTDTLNDYKSSWLSENTPDLLLYFYASTATTSSRLTERDSNHSRFDKIDTSERVKYLEEYKSILHDLYKSSPCKLKTEFSTEVSPSDNAEAFRKLLGAY